MASTLAWANLTAVAPLARRTKTFDPHPTENSMPQDEKAEAHYTNRRFTCSSFTVTLHVSAVPSSYDLDPLQHVLFQLKHTPIGGGGRERDREYSTALLYNMLGVVGTVRYDPFRFERK